MRQVILIVDEVDDLVVNENPTISYVKDDVDRTPVYRRCYQVCALLPCVPRPVCTSFRPQYDCSVTVCCDRTSSMRPKQRMLSGPTAWTARI